MQEEQVFYKRLKSVLGIQHRDTIQGTDQLSNLDGWDSLSMLEFMSMADTKYKVDLDPERISGCKTVHDLAGLVLVRYIN